MRTLLHAAALLLLVAGLWALALGDPMSRVAGSPPAAGATSAPTLHPALLSGSDSLEARRVLAEADGLHTPLPDGNEIVFMGAEGNVAIRDLNTAEVRTLTDDGALQEGGGFAYGFSVSPDGDRIAFIWSRGEFASLRMVDVTSGVVQELVPEAESLFWVHVDPGSWAPDGRSLAAVLYLRDGSRRIASVPVDGGEPTTLRSFDWRAPERLAFSADGQWLAYDVPVEQDSPIRDIRLLATDGSREVPLLEGTTNHRVVGWMPGEGPFFFLEGDPAQSTLLAAEMEGGQIVDGPWTVRADLHDPWPRGFAGDAFYYVQMPERRQAHTVPIDVAAGEPTGPLTPLDPGRALEWPLNMAWSPEGDRAAYIAAAPGDESTLVVRSLTTGAERIIPVPFSEQFTRIEWSPAEGRLAVGGVDNRGRGGVHLLDLADGSVELLLRSDRELVGYDNPRWAPDGRALYAIRRDIPDDSWRVIRVDLEDGREELVFDGSGLAPGEAIAVSPDGRNLAVAYGYGAGSASWDAGSETVTHLRVVLASISEDPREPRELANLGIPEGTARGGHADLEWTPNGSHLLIGAWRALWVANRDGTSLQPVEGVTGIRPRIRPNGRELSVIAGENRWEIWALEGLAALREGHLATAPETR